MKRVGFHTLGCKVNQYETEAMEELFKKEGYKLVEDGSLADVYVINTCTVTNISARKSRQFINRAKKINPEAIIAVVGCYSQISPEEVLAIEGVNVIIGTTDRNRIVELCEEALKENKKINIVRDIKGCHEFEEISIDDIRSKTRAYIKVQDGCNQYCSYCIIPYARGPIRSREIEDILSETKKLVQSGFKEVVLTGIHVASYGNDLKDLNLAILIEEIAKVEGIDRIRLSSLEQSIISEEFLKKIAGEKKVCNHFHLSLQSGSNTVLKRMNRKYTSEEYREKVDLIRKYMPDAGITTDIIVGFPGETEEEFQESLKFVRDIGFSRIHVFKYSKRKGTPAADYKLQVNGNIKNERSKILIEVGETLNKAFNERFINNTIKVLYEEKIEDDIYQGYTSNYIRVRTNSKKNLINKILDTYIYSSEDIYLKGILGGEDMEDCLFCKIIRGEIPSDFIYEDEKIVVFPDIDPQAPVHLLLVPKNHIESANNIDDNNKDLIGHIFKVARDLGEKLELENGYRIVNNCKEDGGQTVDHIHFHLLGGRKMLWPPG